MPRPPRYPLVALSAVIPLLAMIPLVLTACADAATTAPTTGKPNENPPSLVSDAFLPLSSSVACTDGGTPDAVFTIPPHYTQSNIASEPDYLGNPDMITQNETGPEVGRFLYQTHELGSNTGVSVTDLVTGTTRMLVSRADWGSLDGIVWTPWGTILFAEERGTRTPGTDPDAPHAAAGLVFELNPTTLEVHARPALGAKSHEGQAIDSQGNVYGISEANPGYIYKFIPDTFGDLRSGQLYALKITNPTGDRTGEAQWVPLDRGAVQIDASAAATAAGATGYNRPEDLTLRVSPGVNGGVTNVLYVALTGPSNPVDNRIIAIDLGAPDNPHLQPAFVYDYVKWGLNVAQADFEMPDNVAFDRNGNLFITEDPATAPNTKRGDDIWVATPPSAVRQPAASVTRFASLTDCQAEPTGLYFDVNSGTLFVHAQHRGGDGLDKTVAIRRE